MPRLTFFSLLREKLVVPKQHDSELADAAGRSTKAITHNGPTALFTGASSPKLMGLGHHRFFFLSAISRIPQKSQPFPCEVPRLLVESQFMMVTRW